MEQVAMLVEIETALSYCPICMSTTTAEGYLNNAPPADVALIIESDYQEIKDMVDSAPKPNVNDNEKEKTNVIKLHRGQPERD